MVNKRNRRIITEYEGTSHGPLLVIIAAIHGNEQAGIKALRLVEKMLEVEPITNPLFSFRGKLLGLVGNISATSVNMRFIDQDMNRMWSAKTINRLKHLTPNQMNSEEKELIDLLSYITSQVDDYNPSELFILDLHTTSSGGGIFAIPTEDPRSYIIAKNLHAPVILDMLKGISGTTLHYFNNENFPHLTTTSVTFEAGQHDDLTSVNRCIAAIVNCIRSLGCVNQADVENIHDQILKTFSAKHPVTSKLLYKHTVKDGDGFEMKLGYKNFDRVKKGEHLANDFSGPIHSKEDGLILMPLYQSQGEEGFYLIRPLN